MVLIENAPQGPERPLDPSYNLSEEQFNELYGGAATTTPEPTAINGESAPVQSDVEYGPAVPPMAEKAPVVSDVEYGPPAPKERASVRSANRIADLATRFSGFMSERRTSRQLISDVSERGRAHTERGRQIARAGGRNVLKAAKGAGFFAAEVGNGFKETGKFYRDETRRTKEDVKGYLHKRAEAAAVRKDARQDRASDRAEYKATMARERQESRAANRAARLDRRNDRRSDRAEFWQTQRSAAKRAGKAALETGVGLALLPVGLAAEGASRTAAKGREVKAGASKKIGEAQVKRNTSLAAKHHTKSVNAAHQSAIHEARATGAEVKLK
jgi:hypothetical protein